MLVYLYSFPYFDELKSANELPRIFVTTELVDRGTFAIDGRLGELGSRFDVATTPDGRHFSNKAPGLSLLAVPGYLALKAWHGVTGGSSTLAEQTWVFRVTAVTVPALLFLIVFGRVARRFAPDDEPRSAALVAYALGSLALPYGILFFSHQVAAACVGAAFWVAIELCRGQPARRDAWAVALGALAGLAVLTDYQAALGAVAVGVYLVVRSPRRVRDAALAAAGSVPFAVILCGYHWACFGSPLRTGYSYAVDTAHDHGVIGIVGPSREAMWNATLAPDNGLFVLMPWVVLAIAGGVVIARSRELRARVGAEAITAGAIVVAYVLFVGSLMPEMGRAGWSVGPRYIAVCIPFAAWLAAAALQRADGCWVWRAVALAPVVTGVAIYTAAAATYPHWPTSFANPLHELSLRLIAEGMAPHSLATALGLRGALAYAPLFLAVAALAGWLIARRDRRRWLSLGIAAVVAFAWVAAYRGLARTPDPSRPWSFIQRTWEPKR